MTRFHHATGLGPAACLFAAALLVSCGDAPTGVDPGPPPLLTAGVELYGYSVVEEHPHDPDAFTQGLVLDDGALFEGTGLYGRSTLRRVDRETGEVLQRHDLDPAHFGEGVTVLGDRLIQLTWRSHVGFVHDRESFQVEREFTYSTEGWGLTHDGARLIMSDGTSTLHMLDPDSFERVGSVSVRDDGVPVDSLNELEYVEGRVLANVWMSDRIAVIDPASGEVEAWLDLSGLLPAHEREEADVLNGIAFDPETRRLLVTGKLWPRLYEIVLVPAQEALGLAGHLHSLSMVALRGAAVRGGVGGALGGGAPLFGIPADALLGLDGGSGRL